MLPGSATLAVFAPALIAVGCAETSPSGVVVAPLASASSPSTVAAQPGDAGVDAMGSDPDEGFTAADGDSGAPARFRACHADADCVAVPRVGCCHNGWNEAVAASQRDAYAASFACAYVHPVCAMFIVRDSRVARCDPAAHLCTMATPAAK
jgi:hypothetical protein